MMNRFFKPLKIVSILSCIEKNKTIHILLLFLDMQNICFVYISLLRAADMQKT